MPRIRTIKPEFWRNKQLANLPEFTRLLAIALLNYSDDEGFFECDEALIRGECFPYEIDVIRITVAVRELSGIGYVVIKEVGDKTIGMVTKFKDHQVVNKPKKSKLKCIFEGETKENTEVRDEYGTSTVRVPSGKEGKGKEVEGNGKEPTEKSSSLSWIDRQTEKFQVHWRRWLEHLKQKNVYMTQIELETALMNLARCYESEEDRVAVIEFSIACRARHLILNGDHKKTMPSAIKPKQKTVYERPPKREVAT